MLPFATEQFFALFASYNAAIWPAQLVAYALGIVALVFALTVVKVKRGDPMQGFDHTIEPSLVPQEKTE